MDQSLMLVTKSPANIQNLDEIFAFQILCSYQILWKFSRNQPIQQHQKIGPNVFGFEIKKIGIYGGMEKNIFFDRPCHYIERNLGTISYSNLRQIEVLVQREPHRTSKSSFTTVKIRGLLEAVLRRIVQVALHTWQRRTTRVYFYSTPVYQKIWI